MSDPAVIEPTARPRPRVRLVTSSLRVSVTCKPDDGAPFGEGAVVVKPFNRADKQAYFEGKKPFLDPAGNVQAGQEQAHRDYLAKAMAERIVEWEVEMIEGTIADINPGTVAILPDYAFEQVMDAIFGASGAIVKN